MAIIDLLSPEVALAKFDVPSSGVLQRSNPKSIFLNFQKTSLLANWLMPNDGSTPYIMQGENVVEVTVLQVTTHNAGFLAEVIKNSDFNPEPEGPEA